MGNKKCKGCCQSACCCPGNDCRGLKGVYFSISGLTDTNHSQTFTQKVAIKNEIFPGYGGGSEPSIADIGSADCNVTVEFEAKGFSALNGTYIYGTKGVKSTTTDIFATTSDVCCCNFASLGTGETYDYFIGTVTVRVKISASSVITGLCDGQSSGFFYIQDFNDPITIQTGAAGPLKSIRTRPGVATINNSGFVTTTQSHQVFVRLTNGCVPSIEIVLKSVGNELSWGGDWQVPTFFMRGSSSVTSSYARSSTLLVPTGVITGVVGDRPLALSGSSSPVKHINQVGRQIENWYTRDPFGNILTQKQRTRRNGPLRPIAWSPMAAFWSTSNLNHTTINLGSANRKLSSFLVHPVPKPAPVYNKYICFEAEEVTGNTPIDYGTGTSLELPNLFPLRERFYYLNDPQTTPIPAAAEDTNEIGTRNLARYWMGRRNGTVTEYDIGLGAFADFVAPETVLYRGSLESYDYGNHLLAYINDCVSDFTYSANFTSGSLSNTIYVDPQPNFANSSIAVTSTPDGTYFSGWSTSVTPLPGRVANERVYRIVYAPEPPEWNLKIGSFSSCEQDTEENRRRVTTEGDTRVTTLGDERGVSL